MERVGPGGQELAEPTPEPREAAKGCFLRGFMGPGLTAE